MEGCSSAICSNLSLSLLNASSILLRFGNAGTEWSSAAPLRLPVSLGRLTFPFEDSFDSNFPVGARRFSPRVFLAAKFFSGASSPIDSGVFVLTKSNPASFLVFY